MWQPIETAPKVRTHILGIIEGAVLEMYWKPTPWKGEDTGEWCVPTLSSHGCGCCSSKNEQPTHWMPIPAIPEGVRRWRDGDE